MDQDKDHVMIMPDRSRYRNRLSSSSKPKAQPTQSQPSRQSQMPRNRPNTVPMPKIDPDVAHIMQQKNSLLNIPHQPTKEEQDVTNKSKKSNWVV